MSKWHYDVVVIGAGPAGARAAEAASSRGIKVLVLDTKSRLGTPVQCAEYVPSIVRRYVQLMPGSIVQKIDSMLTFINGQLASTLAAPGYMLDRVAFDSGLVRRAQEAGAEVWLGARAVFRTNRGIIAYRKGQGEVEVTCEVIIGADGPHSTVGKWIQSENHNFMVGLQYRMPLCKRQSSTDIYFAPEYVGGYAWLFPKGDTANVGVGVTISHRNKIQYLIKDFIRDMVDSGKLVDAVPLGRTGGLIPVGGPLGVTQRDNILLAGDAAGHTHAVTGGGIMNAIVTGELAGKVAAEAVLQRDLSLLAEYPRQWQSVLGRYLDKATRQRENCDRNWTYDPEQFLGLIRRTWISFAG